ncbi:unnamed protein product [Lactuca saligna]|uniref:NADH:quinone oxidoreductase/Mrp antiporter transmembrane domain-containing protein n=1 Tax=Lactuca saligna TaxID=75948 RepID=A0AA35Z9M0_LACSI|nr:unnamed protein product [Lactuca saligna]
MPSLSLTLYMWAPDIYEGSPTPVTTFLSIAPKISISANISRLSIYGSYGATLQQIFFFCSIASMILGAMAAMAQTKVKRLLAHSSIGRVGYIRTGFSCGTIEGIQSLLIGSSPTKPTFSPPVASLHLQPGVVLISPSGQAPQAAKRLKFQTWRYHRLGKTAFVRSLSFSDEGKREAQIENSTTASKIAIQASAKERRGHKQAQESKQGRIEELRQQASEKESLKGTEARSFRCALRQPLMSTSNAHEPELSPGNPFPSKEVLTIGSIVPQLTRASDRLRILGET